GEDWGDQGIYIKVVKGELEVVNPFWAGSQRALDSLIDEWSPKGTYFEYFKDEHDVELKITSEEIMVKPTGARYKKLAENGGLVIIKLKIK
ncbi:MAG: hypothetical protein KAI79_05035, partial [Bacteroidales bacterium]|nr:hypothetical protein [Bacteroidales bacterium]